MTNRKTFSKIYACVITALFLGGELLLLCLPTFRSLDGTADLIVGLIAALIFAPTVHELGHICFAYAMKMKLRYTKFFCVKIKNEGGRYEISLANPFASDETQTVPTVGGNMRRRATLYALGGLIFSGAVLFLLLSCAVILSAFGIHSAKLWGLIPFFAYLFFANCFPLEYESGKTDALIVKEIKKNEPVAAAFLSAMEIQGRAFSGEEYSKIDETLFQFPVLAEDEPIFAICKDLQYRRALDEGDLAQAADALKRLAQCEEYLSDFEVERLAAELTYMYAIGGDCEKANACAKICEKYLKSNYAAAKRILATVALVGGKVEETKILKKQAEALLEKEDVLGEKALEEKLLSRLTFDGE